MKYLIILSALALFCSCSTTRFVQESYYDVDKNGNINRKTIVETRTYTYDKKGNFVAGESRIGSSTTPLASAANAYYQLPLVASESCQFDDAGRITAYTKENEQHTVKYNKANDIVKDSTANNLITYDYVYVDFSYINAGGNQYISGMKVDKNSEWLAQTTKLNGLTVQYIERKIRNKKF